MWSSGGMQISLQNGEHGLRIGVMSSGRVFRFAPTPQRKSNHLFVFLHACGATAQSAITIAFNFQASFQSAGVVVASDLHTAASAGATHDWYPTRRVNSNTQGGGLAAVLLVFEALVRGDHVTNALK